MSKSSSPDERSTAAASPPASPAPLTLNDLQRVIQQMYGAKDAARGIGGTFMWFSAEVGELAEALRQTDRAALQGEFADVLAWLATLANVAGINLDEAVTAKYRLGCPGCRQLVCQCPPSGKP